jgi:hypothetical protein
MSEARQPSEEAVDWLALADQLFPADALRTTISPLTGLRS